MTLKDAKETASLRLGSSKVLEEHDCLCQKVQHVNIYMYKH